MVITPWTVVVTMAVLEGRCGYVCTRMESQGVGVEVALEIT